MSDSALPMPDAILFDLGGVLMEFGGLQRLATLSGCEEGPELRSEWVSSQWLQAFERGQCDVETFSAGVVRDWRLDLTPAGFVEEFARWPAGPFGGSLELVRGLHGSIRMGCLSNTNPVHWQKHLDHWGLVDYFDWTFVSHELGMMKPDPEVFRHVIQSIGTTPDRLLFLDDCHEHVLAARRLGIRAEQTRGVTEVRDTLISLLPRNSDAGHALRSLASGHAGH